MNDFDGLPAPARARAMLTISVAIVLAVLDTAIANIALPTIARSVDASPAASIWVINAYQLAVVMSLLPLASLGDIAGYRRVFSGGLLLFTLASLACCLAPSLPTLVLARAAQGLGAAGIMSVNTALVRFIFPRAILGRGIAIVTLTVATSAAAGPSVAAAILSLASWQWLFAVNVPLGAAALWLARGSLPPTPISPHGFDPVSAALNAATFGLLITAVDNLGQGESSAVAAVQLTGALALGIGFVRRQFDLPAPMLPVDLMRLPAFALSLATAVFSYIAQTAAYVSLPFYFQYAAGMSQVETGLLVTPWPASVVIVAQLAGRLSDRLPAGLLSGLGLAALTAGLLLLRTVPIDAAWGDIAWRMALCGIGFGFFQTPNNRAIITSAPRERSGAASGMLSTARLLGQTMGAALVAALFGFAEGGRGVAAGAAAALGCGAAFSGVGALLSFLRLRSAKPRRA